MPSAGGRLLEIGSGTGAHLSAWSAGLPAWEIQPSEADATLLPELASHSEVLNVSPPVLLDAASTKWPVDGPFDGVIAVNVCHYSPPQATRGLFAGAGRLLRPGGMLCLYGPFRRPGVERSLASRLFGAALWLKDAEYAVRDTVELHDAAEASQLRCTAFEPQLADILFLVFTKEDETTLP